MGILEALKTFRQRAADVAFCKISVEPDEATRISAWFCFASSIAILSGEWLIGFLTLLTGLIFDVADGAMARRRGLNRPQVDWAADRFTEFAIFSALIYSRPGALSLTFFLLFMLNNFLPRGRVPVLPLRQALAIFLLVRLLTD